MRQTLQLLNLYRILLLNMIHRIIFLKNKLGNKN